MEISTQEYHTLNAKLQGIFELRDIMMKVRNETKDSEKNHALSNAIHLSFELVDNYLKEMRG